MLSRFKIKIDRLALTFVFIIALFLVFGVVTIQGLVTIGELTETIYNHPLVVSNASLNAALNITKMHRSMRDMVFATTLAQRNEALIEVQQGEMAVFHSLDVIENNILGDEGKRLENQTRAVFVAWKPIRERVIALIESGEQQAAVHITQSKGADHVALLETKMLELSAYARNKATIFLEGAKSSQARLEKITMMLTLIGVLLSVAIATLATIRTQRTERVLLTEKERLEQALAEIKTLRGIIPICSHCKQIRDDKGSWILLEAYIHDHSDATFSHGICPKCLAEHYPDIAAKYAANPRPDL